MGVKHLWDILESCKKNLPLHHLQNKRLCIDLSCWIVQLQNVCKSHASMKEKFYLRSLFHRLRALIALNCRLIFVTDGSIPAIKLSTYKRRLGSDCEVTQDEENSQKMCSLRRNMGSEFSCMIKEAKILGMALGIPCLDGVEEAEAQCALLNSESLCDGCFTTDSDAFLFGARTVYRDICLGEGGFVVCYEMVDIERELGFGRNSLISLALLLGSDYSQGVHGLGPERACQFVKAVGDDIALQLVASEGLKFMDKIKKSKKKGQICKSNENEENGFAHKIYNSGHDLCSMQDDQFLQVIDAYLKPKCHSPDSAAVHRVLAQHLFHRDKLQQICSEFFGWPPEKTDEYILPKIAERDLRRFANLRSTSSDLGVQLPLHMMPVRCPISGIIKPRKVQGRECFEVAWEGFDGLKTSIVPSDLIKSACPEKVEEFDEEKAQRKKKSCKPGAKKPEKEASVTEVDLKLQGLLLDIEAGSNILFKSDVCSIEKKSEIRDTVVDATHANQKKHDFLLDRESESNSHDLVGSNDTEVIDLLSPSPPIHSRNASKCQEATYQQIDVIDLSESETEVSPAHQRKARELRSFLASIKDDIH